jgi:predicted aspartyl protease
MEEASKFAATVRFNGAAGFLDTDLLITVPHGNTHYSCRALWDTGATNTMISRNVVEILGLKPISFATVIGFHGEEVRLTYEVSLVLGKSLAIPMIIVLGAETLTQEHEALIGMDIISKLDFAITNLNGNTTHSIRFPSVAEIDFEAC